MVRSNFGMFIDMTTLLFKMMSVKILLHWNTIQDSEEAVVFTFSLDARTNILSKHGCF